MSSIKLKRPSANSLVVFDVASRHLSFSAAADELGTTRVAVSSQVKLLESHLNTQLFDRVHQGLKLTNAGQILAESVARSFRDISIAIERVSAHSDANRLVVSVSQGMSSHWFMPRISKFRRLYPEADIRFQVTDVYVDLAREGVDIALRYGDGPWPGMRAKKLMQIKRFPVCSPDYLKRSVDLRSPEDLPKHELLYLSGNYGALTRWDAWLHSLGFDQVELNHKLTFDDHNSLIEAALAGQGIALAGPPHISHYLGSNQLVRIFKGVETLHRYFWIVEPEQIQEKPLASAFSAWLEREMFASMNYIDVT